MNKEVLPNAILYPDRLDKATKKNYAKIIQDLEALPQDPEFPFALKDFKQSRDYLPRDLFIAPNKKGEYIPASPAGFFKIDKSGRDIDTKLNGVKLETCIGEILKQHSGSLPADRENNYLDARIEHQPFYIILETTHLVSASFRRYRFGVVGGATDADFTEAMEASLKMARKLHEKKYNGPRLKHEQSLNVLENIKKRKEK